MGVAWFDWALGLNTLTSKNVLSNLPPHTPQAEMSNRAHGSVWVVLCEKDSPVSG